MKLSWKYLLISLVALTVLPLVIGGTSYRRLKKQRLNTITADVERELGHLQFALSRFFEDVKNDLSALSMIEVVRTRDDRGFTSFLDADEETFQYDYNPVEKQIIHIFASFREEHPYVNSVYMGRENGTFVRSHERAMPTKYDPRVRPWYVTAKEHSGKVVRTYPYQSVTTSDINLGVVKTLQDSSGEVYGVIGMDVTLVDLSDYISDCRVGRNGQIILVDNNGKILACKHEELLYQHIETLFGKNSEVFMQEPTGVLRFENHDGDNFVFYISDEDIGFKIGIIIPEEQIDREIASVVWPTVLDVFIGIGLVCLLLLVGLRQFVLLPLDKLLRSIRVIGNTGELSNRVSISTKDEFGELGNSFNSMIENLQKARESLENTEKELRHHQDNLEKLVIERTHELELSQKDALSSMEEAIWERNRAESVSKKLEDSLDKLQKLERLRDDLTNMIIHDMRNPLSVIISSVELINSKDLPEKVRREMLNSLEISSNELNLMIETLLDVTCLEHGQMPVNIERCDVYSVAAKSMMAMRLSAKYEKVKLELSGDKYSANADESLTYRIIINLLSNAIKYSPIGETVKIEVSETDGGVRVAIKDKGPGIPENYWGIIFEKFGHVDLRQLNIKRSIGLGLAFCKMAVEAQHGEIGVNSVVGEGSEFWFTLPG